jgi:hypothetical protein
MLTIPKPIIDFLESVHVDVEGYLTVSIVNFVEADFEEWLANNHFMFNQCRLERVFSEYTRSLYPFSVKRQRKIKKEHGV